ncbi:MAG: homoserine kinase [Clostridiales bacterium]|nr:homoserine kinase [Clostridiales bacterium]
MRSVIVPATTANLGPGFDCLGLALSLYARFTFEKTDAGLEIAGCPPEFAGEDNLVYRAFRSTLQEFGQSFNGLRITVDSDIPPARGLGSSAACAVAGVVAAALYSGVSLTPREILQRAARLEGHPDNAAPAVYGGLRASLTEEGAVWSTPCPVHPSLRFLALVPDFALPTARARAALPDAVSRADAVYNLSRAAFLLRAMETGDPEALRFAFRDRLHQPYRFPLIPGGGRLAARMESLGADGCFISGAGPTLMCVYRDAAFAQTAQDELKNAFPRFSALPLSVSQQGYVID